MNRNKWPALRRGDTIHMIAPGMAFDRPQFQLARRLLAHMGLKVEVPKNILGKHAVCANTRNEREKFLRAALVSKAKVIWAARGGYGSLHLLSALQKMKKPKTPKLLIGFSDISTLHHFVNQKWGWPSLHGPHIDKLANLNEARLVELMKILFGQKTELTYKNIKPLNVAARRLKTLKSSLTGGNLITTQSTIGTRWQLSCKNKILFLEDIGERGYRVDRVLEHMHSSGMLNGVRAVIFGPFVGGKEPDGGDRVPKVLQDFADRMKFPVLLGVASGHIPNSLSIPLNTPAVLQKRGKKFEMTVSTGVVAE